MIIVLDLNGVLVDVRRYEDPIITKRPPDIVLPNRQKAYLNPFAKEFIDWLTDANVMVVLYTSRTRNNAAPIEHMISHICPQFKPVLMLHQEDCDGMDGWRPLKSSDVVMNHLGPPNPDGIRTEDIVFVDDHPDRIKLSGATAIRVNRYDALKTDPEESHCDLRDVMWKLHHIFQKKV